MIEMIFASLLGFQGHWFKPCERTLDGSQIHEELTILGTQWIRDTHVNSGQRCKGEDEITLRRVYRARAQEPDLDLETISVTYEARTLSAAATLNATRFCGLTDWQVSIPREVAGVNCGAVTALPKHHITYSTFRLHPRKPRDLLWIGEATENADGTSPENRHLIFELYAFERKD